MSARYRIHQHPAFTDLLSKDDLYVLVDRGSLARGDLCTDTSTGMDHTVGEIVANMRPPRAAGSQARVSRPSYQEIRADLPCDDDEQEVPELEDDPETDEEEEAAAYTDSGERILYHKHPSWLSSLKALFLALLLVVAAVLLFQMQEDSFIIALLCSTATLTCIAIARFSRDYYVTEERVEVVWGIIGRSSKEVRICDIRSIDVHERGLKGLLGLGSVDFSSAANAGVEVQFRDIRGAHQVKQLIRQLQRGADD